jgi:hypothetical protein
MSENDGMHGIDDTMRRLLALVLDEILPAGEDGRMPSAGDVGLAAGVAAAAAASPELASSLAAGLELLEQVAGEANATDFSGLDAEARVGALTVLSERQPEAFEALLMCAYGAYYQHPRVVEALGLPARPPFPEGYDMAPLDTGLLDGVRRRPRLYREV